MKTKLFLTALLLVIIGEIQAQSMSCQKIFDIVTTNYDSKDSTSCYNSTMLVRVEYYRLDGNGYVVAYIKSNQYDYRGKPYVFCGISQQLWSKFKIEGMYGSWGESFHNYIRDYTCDCY